MFDLQITNKMKAAVSDDRFRVFVNVKDDDSPVELLIMDQIGESWFGEGVTGKHVVDLLAANAGRDVNVRINSPGGLVYDGLVIYNALNMHAKHVNVTIEGLAFSAASFVAMAGDRIKMHEASDIGIHRAMGFSFGNAKTARGLAEWLDTIDGHLVDIYAARTGKSADQIEQWLDGTDDGTLFSAKEAVEHGFADEIIPLKSKPAEKVEQAEAAVKNRVMATHKLRLARMRE